MAKADRVHITPPFGAPVKHSRRNFFSTATDIVASGIALASAVNITTIATTRPAAAKVALDIHDVSQELRNPVLILHDADEAAGATRLAFNAEYELYETWLKQSREPRSETRRAWRKWRGRYNKYMSESGFGAAQDAWHEALSSFEDARAAVARYRARDTTELVHKPCLVFVFESGEKRHHIRHIIAQGVARDVASLGVNGRLTAPSVAA
jgi:hypothetical protein